MRICVFCGSRSGRDKNYVQKAREIGRMLAERQIGLVYGGGNIGCMGEIADSALQAGGEVIGVIPVRMVEREIAHTGLSHLHVVNTMHERKALMAKLSDAFLVLPGGIGTLEEFFEIWSWAYLGVHNKPIGILNVNDYFTPLLQFIDQTVQEGFTNQISLNLLITGHEPQQLIDCLVRQCESAFADRLQEG